MSSRISESRVRAYAATRRNATLAKRLLTVEARVRDDVWTRLNCSARIHPVVRCDDRRR